MENQRGGAWGDRALNGVGGGGGEGGGIQGAARASAAGLRTKTFTKTALQSGLCKTRLRGLMKWEGEGEMNGRVQYELFNLTEGARGRGTAAAARWGQVPPNEARLREKIGLGQQGRALGVWAWGWGGVGWGVGQAALQ